MTDRNGGRRGGFGTAAMLLTTQSVEAIPSLKILSSTLHGQLIHE